MSDDTSIYAVNDSGEACMRVSENVTSSDPTSIYGVNEDGKAAVRVLGADGGGDQHNLGWYATPEALSTTYATATAGDWAIVGSTDTVWIWDTDTNTWKDSDQKGQVTSVNGQTGAVVLSIPDAIQYSIMPTASADNLGDIVQFTGTTDANYTNGYFYKCVSDGQDPATYSWTQTNVQPAPSGLPDQTGQSGKFLTTDGTDATWSDKPVIKDASSEQIIVGDWGLSFKNAEQHTYRACIRPYTTSIGQPMIGLGGGTDNGVSLLIGRKYYTINGVGSTYNAIFAVSGKKYNLGTPTELFGSLFAEKIQSADNAPIIIPSVSGTMAVISVNTTATLAVADWSSNTQTITVSGVKADSVVFVSPAPASASDYASAGILCTTQAADSLTFTCTTTPSNAITVNVICM